ncbi:uncharacterized protein LOC107466687 [Arachis duranensis]|uniref:Uncharacterized protein LOC107466687 n=1 Tax=Arachis duranensis TaxID=130453 RepID=A0A6P4BPT3_ARADU|nr:uncharacterized protein LOC107466687 [Arachis duranensis]
MRAKVPRNFKSPDMDLYDGTTDPKHHLSNFKSRMYLVDTLDATRCKAFSMTLTKAAMKWFDGLPSSRKGRGVSTDTEDEVGKHVVYFTSKVLQGPELRYQKLEKFAYALIVASRMLRPYFQAHTIKVQTNQPMKQILLKTDIAGRMVQWAMELSEFDLKYETWTAIKAQCLTNFMAEYVGDQEEVSTIWELYMDGSSNKVRGGAGLILVNQEETQIEVSLKFEFLASNNQAEYEALIAGLKLAEEVGVTKIVVFSDSQVVTSQINREYQTKDPNMKRYLDKMLEYLRRFLKTEVRHITREHNSRADTLSKLTSTNPEGNNRSLIQETLQEPFVTKTGAKQDVLEKDATDFVKKCQPCQMYANFHVAPPEELISITSPWPFTKWGLDLLGLFSQAPGQVKYLIVGIDYFTKWIETEPLATITAQRSQKFLYKNIITRYKISHSVTKDNGSQFTDSTFINLVASMKIKHQFTSVEHPQANGQAEAANKVILAGLKKMFQDAKGA